jgi:ribulose-5-phosphate 4-epimerase/fuculose-1-phosphate aldolase
MTDAFIRPQRYNDAEWQARVQLAACYRIFAHLGWSELIYNHISLRVPDEEAHFLINPFGLHYTEVTASNLVKVDSHGHIIGHSDWPINPAGFTFHGAIHTTMPNAHCVMHIHSTPTMAVCCLKDGLSFTNFYAAQLWGQVAYHDFEGITVHMEEGPRVLKSIGNKQAVILRNHGLVSWGSTLPEAFAILWTLQRACEIQMATLSMGQPLPVPEAVAAKCTRDSLQFDQKHGGAGVDVFDALTRQVDRIDDSYKH